MTYDENLAARVRALLDREPGSLEKAMFGGTGFLVNGNMACGVYQNGLIVRIGPERYPAALGRPHVHPMDITGRPMTGWVMVAPEGCQAESDLQEWVAQGVAFARSLPPKLGTPGNDQA